MSAPPPPDTFGNYALGDFVEVVSPADISWWPQTVGWWWLGALLAGFAAYRGSKALRRWYRNRYRREAAQRLQRLATAANAGTLVADINRLLKLTALVAYSREQVARLSGEEWVNFLNRQCPTRPFSPEHCDLLALAGYTGRAVEAGTAQELLAASLVWVREHESPRHD
ncbi:MAG: DUF4381 domain-containing protein [Halioglobus sp.]|nr:DUF4381 domain-containing protein [Halioglobus sp.]